MPASLPGSTLAQNIANPSLGAAVIFDALSGPKGSPLDRDDTVLSWDANGHPVYTQGAITKASTGGLSTGIGYGSPPVLQGPAVSFVNGGALLGFGSGGFNDNYQVGGDKPDGNAAADSTYVYVGGGRSTPIAVNASGGQSGVLPNNPYTNAMVKLGMAGNGGSRDAGAGPAFTAFSMKTVTATADTANGAAVEVGFTNRSGVAIKTGQSVFGSDTTPNPAVV